MGHKRRDGAILQGNEGMKMTIDHKHIIGILFALFAVGILLYGTFAGLILIFSLVVFGALSTYWKEKELKLLSLGAIVLLSLLSIGVNGMKFGIDFSGGTRIPVILESPADQTTMNDMVDIVKKRASAFGLTEVKVRAVGESEINVEVPSGDPELIASVEDLLSHQGVFEGIVDGKTALSGDAILPGTIQGVAGAYLGGADWGVQFSVTRDGAEHFAETVEGKANFPLYMFLDRPKDAIVVLSWEEASANLDIADRGLARSAFTKALSNDDGNITVYIYDELNVSSLSPATNKTRALLSESMDSVIGSELEAKGFTVQIIADEDLSPSISQLGTGEFIIDEWKAVGLLSSPVLSPSVTVGTPNYGYIISGSAEGAGQARQLDAYEKSKGIESILKGGALPIQISLGSRTTIPAPLGEEFLRLSIIGIFLALIAISLLVSFRYRRKNILLPIVAISISELIILLAILGSFTIDLAAMAGIIAAIGVGVDAQIVITDELLKKSQGTPQDRLENAFAIITTNVTVAIFAMTPLLFSGMVEIIGFAISTIMGSLLGLLISRPAYAALVGDIAEE
jgi:preprotein translocase subunit SecD